MAKILRLSDIVEIECGEIKVGVSTLSAMQRSEIGNCITMSGGVERMDNQKTALLTIKHSVKQLSGIENHDGTNYELVFEDIQKTTLTENCAVELLTFFTSTPIYDAINMATVGILTSKIKGVSMKVLTEKK